MEIATPFFHANISSNVRICPRISGTDGKREAVVRPQS